MQWFRQTSNGPLARYVKLRVAHAPGMSGTFSPSQRVSDPDMHHGTCVTHVPWCMPGSLTNGLRWRGTRSQQFRRMRSRNFTYLVRGPWPLFVHVLPEISNGLYFGYDCKEISKSAVLGWFVKISKNCRLWCDSEKSVTVTQNWPRYM